MPRTDESLRSIEPISSLPRTVPSQELRDLGIIHEINRRLLHPLGMALAVTVYEDGTVGEDLYVLDYREYGEGEGCRFADDEIDAEKADRFDKLFKKAERLRIEKYGEVIQSTRPARGDR